MTAIPLFQFWDDPDPPDDVATLMEGWRDEPGFDYRRFDSAAARALIAEHFAPGTVAAYDRCGVPAMQADLFRYCALLLHGGVWMDADQARQGALAPWLDANAGPRGLLMQNGQNIANGLMYFRTPGDRLLDITRHQAEANIAAAGSQCVWEVTGPGIMTGMHRQPDGGGLFAGFSIVRLQDMGAVVGFRNTLRYKSGPKDWRRFMHTPGLSIYR